MGQNEKMKKVAASGEHATRVTWSTSDEWWHPSSRMFNTTSAAKYPDRRLQTFLISPQTSISRYNSVSMERFLPQSIICSLRIESARRNKVSTPTQQHHVCATNSFIYLTLLQIRCFDSFLNINPGSSPVSVFLQCSSV